MDKAGNADKKHLTVTELARKIGVSTATISSVLNNRYLERRISPETVKKVQEAARDAGYMPNISARRLRSNSSSHYLVVAIITSYQAPLPLISASLTALHNVIAEPPYHDIHFTTTVDMFDAGKLSELPGLLDGSRFNGAIIANTIPQDDEFAARNSIPVPVVFIGRDIPNYSSVRDSSDKTGREAASVLFNTDSRSMAVLYARLLTQTTTARLLNFRQEAQALTGTAPYEIVAEGFTEKDGYLAMKKFLEEGRKIDGLYTIMDSLAVGAYHAIKEKRLRIPEDIAVIGTGDYPVSPFLDPPLSTFTRSQYNMHEEAVRLLLKHLTGQVKNPTQILVPVLPVLRRSTQRVQKTPENH